MDMPIIYEGDGPGHECWCPTNPEPEINQIFLCSCGKFYEYRRTSDPVWTEKGTWCSIWPWNFRAKKRIELWKSLNQGWDG